MSERQVLLLDTDIGSDVDDVVALALALCAPTIDLVAVTTVYVNTALRTQMVRAVLERAGVGALPIGSGADRPLLLQERDTLYWAGWEGEGLLPESMIGENPSKPSGEVRHAVDLIIETVLARPGTVTILAIGPLTNIALALLREPRLIQAVRRIVIMGGAAGRRLDQLAWPVHEHNIRCDPEAARIVLTSGAPITLVPLDVTTLVRIRRTDLPRLAGGALGALVADAITRYLVHMKRDFTHLHDPLALAAVAAPTLLTTTPCRVQVETQGEFTRGQIVIRRGAVEGGGHGPIIEVALEVAVAAFEEWVLTTLSDSGRA